MLACLLIYITTLLLTTTHVDNTGDKQQQLTDRLTNKLTNDN